MESLSMVSLRRALWVKDAGVGRISILTRESPPHVQIPSTAVPFQTTRAPVQGKHLASPLTFAPLNYYTLLKNGGSASQWRC